MSIRLRELIRQVRACKTANEERECISKECAAIRTAFRQEDDKFRHRNVAKLMFISMLGYPTHFGQMECLKLISSNNFPEKRIGYLGLMLLLDENQEVLMLVTNSLKNDMQQSNQYVVGLALCALANISTSDMCRTLYPEVEKLCRSSNPYIRKKAALSAIRVVRKVEDLAEEFLERTSSLLNERNHGVLITAVSLLNEICITKEGEHVADLRRLVPQLVRHLKNLVLSGYAPEHDVSGITDPFLQIKIINVMKWLGAGDSEASDQMNDILAQVATNTETSKNAGNAILYACVQTIMGIESESGLRVLAINILGRFLLNRDNNIRYVALNTLQQVLVTDAPAVQRHRKTIVECLKDTDVSIRRRALALTCGLVNESNVRVLVRELLNFLMTAEGDLKEECVDKICSIVLGHSPSARWRTDTTVRVMELADSETDNLLSGFVQVVASTPELQGYAVQKLYIAANEAEALSNLCSLLKATYWCMGEFAQMLVAGQTMCDDEEPIQVTEDEVLDFFDKTLRDTTIPRTVHQYGLTGLVKLANRLSAGALPRIRQLVSPFMANKDMEMQQRAIEFSQLLSKQNLWDTVLAAVPAANDGDEEEAGEAMSLPSASAVAASPNASAQAAPAASDGLDDMLGDMLGGMGGAPVAAPVQAAPSDGLDDLLGDLLGSGGAPAPAVAAPPMQQSGGGLNDLLGSMDLSGGAQPAAPAPQQVPGVVTHMGYQKNGLTINFECKRNPQNPAMITLRANYLNGTQGGMANFAIQTAVPKEMKLRLQPISNANIAPGATSNQIIEIMNPQNMPLRIMIKIQYGMNGQAVQDQAIAEGFPNF
jgi:AP-1 complex subunit gamma-1